MPVWAHIYAWIPTHPTRSPTQTLNPRFIPSPALELGPVLPPTDAWVRSNERTWDPAQAPSTMIRHTHSQTIPKGER